jgi:hypothetical protein
MTTLTAASFKAARLVVPGFDVAREKLTRLRWKTERDLLADIGRSKGLMPEQALAALNVLGSVRKIRRSTGPHSYYIHDEDAARIFQRGRKFSVADYKAIMLASGYTLSEFNDSLYFAESHRFFKTSDKYLTHIDDTRVCLNCSVRHSDGAAFVKVITTVSRNGTLEDSNDEYDDFCPTCAGNYSFECGLSGLRLSIYASEKARINLLDGRTVTAASRLANRYGYMTLMGVDGWVHESDPRAIDFGPPTDPIPQYHRAPRNWDMMYQVANRSQRAFYGLEIEILFETRGRVIQFYKNLAKREGNTFEHITAERDGSLDRTLGIEIISRPFALDELYKADNPLKLALEDAVALGAKGFNEMTNRTDALGDPLNYGIHITTNWQRMTTDHQERFRQFIYAHKKQSVLIAGRENTRFAHLHAHQMDNTEDRYRGVRPREAYRPFDGAVEIRIFQSTVDYPLALSYVEFLDAVAVWTLDPDHMITGPLAASLFRAWVCHSGAYPHLSARFTKPTAQEATPACASPSQNPEVSLSTPSDSESVSATTLTEPDSPSAPTTARSRSTRASSTSSRSSRRTTSTASTSETPSSTSASPRAATTRRRTAIPSS